MTLPTNQELYMVAHAEYYEPTRLVVVPDGGLIKVVAAVRTAILDALIAEAELHAERLPFREVFYEENDCSKADSLLLVHDEFGSHSHGLKVAGWLRSMKEGE